MSSADPSPIYQAAAVPYRLRNGNPEFCLITSTRKGHWGFPKGIIDPGETPVETAAKEAEEEAGVYGPVDEELLGRYEYYKWGTVLYVNVYLMEVTEESVVWQEAELRQRAWCDAERARVLIERDELRDILDLAVERIGSGAG